MGARSRAKWQNRHARRTLDLVKAGQEFESAVKVAFREIRDRRTALSWLRQMGFGLKTLLAAERRAVKPVIQSKVPPSVEVAQ